MPPSLPARPRIWSLAVAVLAVIGVLVLTGVALLLLKRMQLVDPRLGALTDSTSNIAPAGWTAIASTGAFGLVALVAAVLSPTPFAERLRLDISGRNPARLLWAALMAGFASVNAGSCVMSLFLAFNGGQRSRMLELLEKALSSADNAQLRLITFAALVCAPLCEELFFRGYLQTRLVARFGAPIGVGVASLMFAIAHGDVMHSTAVLPIGLILGYTALRTGSIVSSTLAHFLVNLLAVVGARSASVPVVADPNEYLRWAGFYLLFALIGFTALRRITHELAPA